MTALIVTAVLAGATTVAWIQQSRSHASFLEVSAEAAQLQARQQERPVSRYEIYSSSSDGLKVRVHLWVDTPYEYALDVEAGSREAARAAAPRDGLSDPLARVPYTRAGDVISLEDGSQFRFDTFEEPCPGGEMTSWRLCPVGQAAGCIVAPVADRCYQGAVRLVALYGGQKALWAVVERTMGDRVARMVGGVPLAH